MVGMKERRQDDARVPGLGTIEMEPALTERETQWAPGWNSTRLGTWELKAKAGVMQSLRMQALFQPGLLVSSLKLGHTVGLAGGP